MTAYGFRYADVLSMELGLNTNRDWEVVLGMAEHPAGILRLEMN